MGIFRLIKFYFSYFSNIQIVKKTGVKYMFQDIFIYNCFYLIKNDDAQLICLWLVESAFCAAVAAIKRW